MPVLHVLYSRYKNEISAVVKIRLLLLMIYTENEGKENKKYSKLLSKLYLSTLLQRKCALGIQFEYGCSKILISIN